MANEAEFVMKATIIVETMNTINGGELGIIIGRASTLHF